MELLGLSLSAVLDAISGAGANAVEDALVGSSEMSRRGRIAGLSRSMKTTASFPRMRRVKVSSVRRVTSYSP